jgi:NTE family protein
MDRVYFPLKGSYFKAGLYRSILSEVDLQYVVSDDLNVKGSINGFTKLGLDFEKRFDFNKSITGILGANVGFTFEDSLGESELSFADYGYAAKYSLGGILTAPRRDSQVFAGLHEDELFATQFMRISLGLQISPLSKLYVTPHVDMASIGYQDFNDFIGNAFSPSGNWSYGFDTSALVSAGATFAYHSFLGPVNFDVSWVNDINKVRVFFSVGLLLNRSN